MAILILIRNFYKNNNNSFLIINLGQKTSHISYEWNGQFISRNTV